MIRPPPRSTRTDTHFPYPTLFRSATDVIWKVDLAKLFSIPVRAPVPVDQRGEARPAVGRQCRPENVLDAQIERQEGLGGEDRKSTRLNSSTNAHLVCSRLLEKKKHEPNRQCNKEKIDTLDHQ